MLKSIDYGRKKILTERVKLKLSASKIIQFFEHRLIIKMDCHKLKFFIDIVFTTCEKIFSKFNILLQLYIDNYLESIRKEIQFANISGNHKILNMGCGSIPATCILIAKETNAKITGIDKNLKSVNRAKIIISKLKLDERIEIKHSNALNFHLNDFDIIIIANGINPHYDVLKHVATNMKDDAIVIFKTFSHYNGELESKDYFLNNLFILGKITSHKNSGSLISVKLYKKRKTT
jgi:2-polyprenyl-3-methyl-5-hydroxy-6-metoxy-1,4-benzoquinol methylase